MSDELIDALCILEAGWTGECGCPRHLACQEARRVVRAHAEKRWAHFASKAHRRMADEIEALMADLPALIERLLRAEDPSRATDGLLAEVAGWEWHGDGKDASKPSGVDEV